MFSGTCTSANLDQIGIANCAHGAQNTSLYNRLSLLQRDLRSWGVSVSADNLHRFWRMLAHLQGQLFNASQLGLSLDAVVECGDKRIGIEVKFSSTPKPARGFWQALDDLGIAQAYVIAPVAQAYPLAPNIEVLPLTQLTTQLLGG